MAQWYSVATPGETERLVGAWADAPIENEEWCGFILEVAREQVLDYAPAAVPVTFEPATVTWPTGEFITLTRDGDIVTAAIDPGGDNVLPGTVMPWPAEHFSIAGSASVIVKPHANYAINVQDVGAGDGISFFATGAGPFLPGTARWLADPADGNGIPIRYVVAQLQQATNLWNAGRVSGSGDVGVDQFTYTPRPLDKTIKGIIRPQTGRPRVR